VRYSGSVPGCATCAQPTGGSYRGAGVAARALWWRDQWSLANDGIILIEHWMHITDDTQENGLIDD